MTFLTHGGSMSQLQREENMDRPEGFNYLPEAWRAYIAGLESVRSEALSREAVLDDEFLERLRLEKLAVRQDALEEAAKVCESIRYGMHKPHDRPEFLIACDEAFADGHRLATGRCAEAIRALSPARVAEGDELSRHLEGEHHAIRAQEIDSPTNTCPLKETCQWVKRIALQRPSSPESPAKEQPGEQNVPEVRLRREGDLDMALKSPLWDRRPSDAAAMVKRLREADEAVLSRVSVEQLEYLLSGVPYDEMTYGSQEYQWCKELARVLSDLRAAAILRASSSPEPGMGRTDEAYILRLLGRIAELEDRIRAMLAAKPSDPQLQRANVTGSSP